MKLLRDLYYFLRPVVPRGSQLAIRRWLARRQRRQHWDTWPINWRARKPPDHWPGWPGGKRFAVVLTHDVEHTGGRDKCRALMDVEEKMGFRSSFNFVAERYDTPRAFRDELHARGFEVGLHGLRHDGQLYRTRAIFSERAKQLNRRIAEWGVVGFRSPSMHHNLEWIHDLDITYDASTFDSDPFQPQPKGVETIYPFYVPGPNGTKGYVELPYTLDQDFTLFVLFRDESIEQWRRKLDWVAKHGGMVLVNTHPDYMDFSGSGFGKETYPASLYESLLDYIRTEYKDQYWHALPREMADFVTSQSPLPCHPGIPDTTTTRPPRMCFVRHGQFPDDPILCREVMAQAETGCEVDVLCLHDNHEAAREVYEGVRVQRIPVAHHRASIARYFLEYGVSFLLMSLRLNLLHLRHRYDCIQVNAMPDFLVFTTLLPRLLGVKVLLHLYEPSPELFITKFGEDRWTWLMRMQERLEQWAIRYAHGCFAVSEAIRKRYGERGANMDKITVLRNVSTEAFDRIPPAAPGVSDGMFRLITHGLIEHRNGHEVVLRAMKRLEKRLPGLQYDITGGGEYQPDIERLVHELGLEQRVRFWGYVPWDELVALLQRADVGVITMYASPYAELVDNIRMYEFIALRKPAIVSRFPSIEENLDDRCLSFIEPGNDEDMAEAILELHDHPERAHEKAENAYRVYERLKWSESKRIYLDAVRRMAGGALAAHAGDTFTGAVGPDRDAS